MIIFIPIENIEQRYTKMMNQALTAFCDKVIYPKFDYPETIEKGEFLDINKTCIFKAKQLQMIAEMFYNDEVKDGDVFFVADIFFSGIESIRYMADLQNIKVKIGAFNHAGRADLSDFVQRLGTWADSSEAGYHEICDMIFVGSQFQKDRIIGYFDLTIPVHVTGCVWDRKFVRNVYNNTPIKKQEFIIYPHRLCEEKGLAEFLIFAESTDMKIVITSSGNKQEISLPSNVEYFYNLSKEAYYHYLSVAKYYLSTAYQETFGYTLQEAIHFGCQVAVPNRACYPEMVPSNCLFNSIDEIEFNKVPMKFTERFDNNAKTIINLLDDNSN